MRTAFVVIAACVLSAGSIHAQTIPHTYADSLIDAGRWNEAEAEFYAQSEHNPRDPIARAALGQFLAMKGAVRPGIVLIEEATRFGLSASASRTLLTPLRSILKWRKSAATLTRDSTLSIKSAATSSALFQILAGNDVVDKSIGIDSVRQAGHPIGIEVFEALAPSIDVKANTLTLHANARSALSAPGRRFPVLRSARGIRVLIEERRVTTLQDALAELQPVWWQLDLPHGLLVVR